VPDAPTIGPVWPFVQAHQIGALLFARIGEYRAKHGVQVRGGPIEDASSISVPSSTMPRQQVWDPEMHQIKTGPLWDCRMPAHIGVDSQTPLIHSVPAPAALRMTAGCDRSCGMDRRREGGGSASRGPWEVIRQCAPAAGECEGTGS